MADPESAVEEEVVDPFALFDERIRNAVEGLTYIGQLTDTVHYCNHKFGLRTLKPHHKYAIAQVLQPYRNTVMEVDIFQNLHVAIALTHVDDDYKFCEPIGPDLESFVQARLNYVANPVTGWHPHTLEFLWGQYVLLEAAAATAMRELHRLSTQSQPTRSSPWLDSLTVPGDSQDETSLVFQPSQTSS